MLQSKIESLLDFGYNMISNLKHLIREAHMVTYTRNIERGNIFVGIDIHKCTWHVTIVTDEGEELFSGGIPANGDNLMKLLNRYKRDTVNFVLMY